MIEVMFPRRRNSEVRCPVPRFTPDPFVQPTARVIRVGVIADENSVHPPTNSAVTGSVCGAFLTYASIRYHIPRVTVAAAEF